jgi:hypothetical protein
MLPKTTTEAQAAGGVVLIAQGANATQLSNSRYIPYSEFYRERTAVIETPIERIQLASEDEARRTRKTKERS